MHTYCFSFASNIANYIGIKYLKTEKITILYFKKDNDNISRYMLEKYLFRNGYTNIQFEVFTSKTFAQISKDASIILPPLTKAKELSIYQNVFHYNFKKIYVEDDGDIYHIDKDSVNPIPNDDVDLSVRDFITQTNGSIIQTNNSLFGKKVANELLDYLLDHITTMTFILKTIRPLKRNPEFDQGHLPNPHAVLDITKLDKEQLHIYLGALRLLEKNEIISITKTPGLYYLEFYDLDYKEYFSKAGTWLEHYSQRVLESIKEIDDVNSSVMFIWDNDRRQVKNELDIMAVTDNQLITVSCKDTMKLVDDYLYELESHADSLGSDEAIKIVVTTASLGSHITDRAELLDVHIVNSVNNYDTFREDIIKVIESYKNL